MWEETVNWLPLEIARRQIVSARAYTLELVADLSPAEWFASPPEWSSHIAWQMGHLAMAEYGLTLLRIRGREPDDEQLIPKDFIRTFKKGTSPSPERSDYPTIEVIRQTLDAVHARALLEMEGYDESQLSEPLPAPTAGYDNKLGSLLFCGAHEMLHAGQIGVLRRFLGREPLR